MPGPPARTFPAESVPNRDSNKPRPPRDPAVPIPRKPFLQPNNFRKPLPLMVSGCVWKKKARPKIKGSDCSTWTAKALQNSIHFASSQCDSVCAGAVCLRNLLQRTRNFLSPRAIWSRKGFFVLRSGGAERSMHRNLDGVKHSLQFTGSMKLSRRGNHERKCRRGYRAGAAGRISARQLRAPHEAHGAMAMGEHVAGVFDGRHVAPALDHGFYDRAPIH